MSEIRQLVGKDLDRALLYGVIASLLLHLAAIIGVPIILKNKVTGYKPLIDSHDVTPVRLVEHPLNKAEVDIKPKKQAALSNRNHVVEQERIPKALPAKKKGPVSSPRKKIAAMQKKAAPPKQEKKTEPERKPSEPDKKDLGEASKKMLKDLSMLAPGALGAAIPLSPGAALERKTFDPRLPPEVLFPQEGSAEQSPGLYPEGNPDEPVLDLNTRNDKYFNYLLHLKQRIEAVWVYPRVAAKSGIGGQLTVEFVIAKDGTLKVAKLLDSSGHDILDKAALKALEDGSPFRPFPSRFTAKRLRIRANFVYVTTRLFHRVL